MRFPHMLLFIIALASLVGCSYQPARISSVPAIIIDDGYHRDRHREDRDWDDDDRWERRREWERERLGEARERREERRERERREEARERQRERWEEAHERWD
ncbi:hypothetical protein [Halomonas sp. ND22Bw]|uniref:hypothetical protein n=1 Tax=Halomonas sp. ND22Bw TaxID=2054178 RepID=UPI0011B25A90